MTLPLTRAAQAATLAGIPTAPPSDNETQIKTRRDGPPVSFAFSETICITGGTGSFGSAFSRYLFDTTNAKLRILSRDEHKQERMAANLPPGPRVTYIIGDVRDSDRLHRAFDGASVIVHAAALKTVPTGERHVSEFKMTNIDGTENVVNAAIDCGVGRSLFISSDKACQPINEYGKCKAVGEGLFIQGNALGVSRGSRFAVVRGGNVWGSNGSVLTKWRDSRAAGLPITVAGPETTRFHLPMGYWIEFCRHAVEGMMGGEIFIPKAGAWRLGDLAEAYIGVYGGAVLTTGPRGGDKLHELLISANESPRALDAGWAFVIEPSLDLREVWNYKPRTGPEVDWLHFGATYSSDTADRLTVDELRALLSNTTGFDGGHQ